MIFNVLFLENPEEYHNYLEEGVDVQQSMKSMGLPITPSDEPFKGLYKSQPMVIDPSTIGALNVTDNGTRLTIRLKNKEIFKAIYDQRVWDMYVMYQMGIWMRNSVAAAEAMKLSPTDLVRSVTDLGTHPTAIEEKNMTR